MKQIYTAGYAGHTPAQLKKAADELDAVVIDIRHNPRSRIPGWNNVELNDLLGERYACVHELGNANYNTGNPIRLVDAPRGIGLLLRKLQDHSLILLCGCADFESCHRRTVADLLMQWHSIPTQELQWPEVETEGTIKCISLWQPWASLVAIGAKQIETRHWSTNYTGPLAIHAAKTRKGLEELIDEVRPEGLKLIEPFRSALLHGGIKELPFGTIVAVCVLERCTPTVALEATVSDQERAFGNYAPGRFGWILKNIQELNEPIPYRGAQGLFKVPAELLES